MWTRSRSRTPQDGFNLERADNLIQAAEHIYASVQNITLPSKAGKQAAAGVRTTGQTQEKKRRGRPRKQACRQLRVWPTGRG